MPPESDALSELESAIEDMIAAAETGEPDQLKAAIDRQEAAIERTTTTVRAAGPDMVERLKATRARNELAGRKVAVALDGVRRRRASLSALRSGCSTTYGADGHIRAA